VIRISVMPVDQTPPIQVAPAPNWELPEITDVKIRSAEFKPKAPANFAHPMDAVANAMEIVVSLEAPVPVRAMSPVLWVGDRQLTESEMVDKSGKTMRFRALKPETLQAGAPITMGWMNDRPTTTAGAAARDASRRAKFFYNPPR
jgi:hypothetical protein